MCCSFEYSRRKGERSLPFAPFAPRPFRSVPERSFRETPQAISEWDDDNYDYIVALEDAFGEHYVIKERIGKGSFGQVVRATDGRTNQDVAIKIIKSKKPFAVQARTEIELLLALKV